MARNGSRGAEVAPLVIIIDDGAGRKVEGYFAPSKPDREGRVKLVGIGAKHDDGFGGTTADPTIVRPNADGSKSLAGSFHLSPQESKAFAARFAGEAWAKMLTEVAQANADRRGVSLSLPAATDTARKRTGRIARKATIPQDDPKAKATLAKMLGR